MKINSLLVAAVLAGVAFLISGCEQKKSEAVVEVEQLRQYTEQRFNDLQAHLTVISEQMDQQPVSSSVSLRPDVMSVTPVTPGQPVVQITDITAPTTANRTLKDEIASLTQPVPVHRVQRSTVTRSRSSSKSSKSKYSKTIVIPALSVRDVQQALKNAGFNPGKVDGRMGANTQRAIKQFQKAEGLKADGVIGTRTWDKLSPHLAKAAF